MNRLLPGLYADATLRLEKRDGRWEAWGPLNQVHPMAKNLFEFHPQGAWTKLGSFDKKETCQLVREQLKAGTHLWDTAVGRTRAWEPEIYSLLERLQQADDAQATARPAW